MSRARELSRLGNPNIISADSDYNVGFGTLTPRAKGDFVGVVSATSFVGDGSALTGVAAAGIGTAVSAEKTSPLNNFYYTNQILEVGVSTTFDVPTSGKLGYSQAAEISVANGVDFTVADGDELITDILGISTEGVQPLSGAGGRVRADNLTNRAGTGAPDAPQGFKITATTESTSHTTGALIVSGGVGIAKSLYVGGNVSVAGTLTYDDVTRIDSVGIVTAGGGLYVGRTEGTGTGIGITATAAGHIIAAGVVTATSYYGDGSTLTNAGITAGKAMGLAAFLG